MGLRRSDGIRDAETAMPVKGYYGYAASALVAKLRFAAFFAPASRSRPNPVSAVPAITRCKFRAGGSELEDDPFDEAPQDGRCAANSALDNSASINLAKARALVLACRP